MGEEGVRIEVILVDFQKDKKLAMLKQLITTLVSGSNPASVIKKIAGTVGIVNCVTALLSFCYISAFILLKKTFISKTGI